MRARLGQRFSVAVTLTLLLASWTCASCSQTPGSTAGDPDIAVADVTSDMTVAGDGDAHPTDIHVDVHVDISAADGDAAVDTMVTCPGSGHCPCVANGECDSGLCLETTDGKLCATPCAGESGCLANESCASLTTSGGDIQTLCTPRWVSFCAPCLQNNDCAFPGSGGVTICTPLGASGSFCTATCKAASDCPGGTTCSGGVCHPAGDTCACTNWAVTHQSATPCLNKNAAGQCAAPLKCAATGPWPTCLAATPTAETCNGKDDNCNGLTDDAAGPTCDDKDDCTQDACNGGVCQHLKNIVCGDGLCAAGCGETLLLCPIDCHKCGDKVCSPGESPSNCAEDCCGGCGDGKCVGYECGENPTACPQDCSKPCGDGKCEKGENPGNCAMDCKTQACGNNVCEPTDGGPTGCPKDCAATCGNCVCEKSESFDTCPNDCGYCGDGTCSICGALGEDPKTCLADCGDLAEVGCTSKAWTLFCQDDSPCTNDVCQPGKGCVHLAAAGTCTDGNACTSGDVCANGVCAPGAQVACNDNNPCTSDSCDVASGCTATNAVGVVCNDGDACTIGDVCVGSSCGSGGAKNCSDGNACTDDSCSGGVCLNAANTATCDDKNPCTLADACSETECAGAANGCDDGNSCTVDSCSGSTGACVNTPLSDGAACDSDSNVCTVDMCTQGTCSHNSCDTNATCDAASGCVCNSGFWGDGSVCTCGGIVSSTTIGGVATNVCAYDYPVWGNRPDSPDTYIVNANGTVGDSQTKLMWQQVADGNKYSWAAAATYCDGLTLAGHDDWRLPTVAEGESLRDYAMPWPAINATAFAGTTTGMYWSSIVYSVDKTKSWGVGFNTDTSSYADLVTLLKDVRCVRSNAASQAPATRYSISGTNSDATVLDNATGLVWQQTASASKYTWSASAAAGSAQAYCNALSLNGYASGWRVPAERELFSIDDRTQYNPSITSAAFPTTAAGSYWSAAPKSGGGSPWTVSFQSGFSQTMFGSIAFVRCVR